MKSMNESFILFSKSYIAKALSRDYAGEGEGYSAGLLCNIIYSLQIPIYILLSVPCRIPILDQFCETFSRSWSRGIIGFALRAIYWKTKLNYMGIDVFIDKGVTIFGPRNVSIGSGTYIDVDCCLICTAGSITIGERVHVGNNCIINGRPFVRIGNGVGVSAGCKIYGSTQYYKDEQGKRVSGSPMMPVGEYFIKRVGITIEDFAFLGFNCVLLPGAYMGKYTVLGANSLLKDRLEDYCVAFGTPAKVYLKENLSGKKESG
jgi:acetyltransferase-like isoleucine patch superfamily enzyme